MARLRLVPAALAIVLFTLPAVAEAASGGDAAQRLADAYAPIAMLREEQDPPCETTAEQYEPTSVDTVLGNPDVVLQRFVEDEGPLAKKDKQGLQDVKDAPAAEDIAGLADGYYLNLRGEVLEDTCVYARDFAKLVKEGKAPATTYAHIARESGHSGFALQYWFFWYFNQFNDLHEGDWEGMQLSFEADSPAAALAAEEEPSEIILFQHAGGERANWDDSKVQKEGTHPIVFPAAGSHATFYDSAVYVENGQEGSGLGCDNTSEPLREVQPTPVLLPQRPQLTGPFQWLSYEGRWGEREGGYNNGPTGPQTKTVWSEPFTWMSAQRSTSPRLPGGSVVGPQVSGAFCSTVASISELINLDAKSRPAAIATIAGIVLLIALFVGLTRWGPVDLTRLRARRSFGQLVRTARQLYGRHWRPMVAIGLTAVPIVGGANLLAGLLAGGKGVDDAAGRGGFNLALGDLVEGFARPAAMAVVASVVVVFVRLLVDDRGPGFRAAFSGMRHCFWRVVGGQMLFVLATVGLAITIIGLPVAIYKYVAWSFVKQEIVFENRGIREAFHASSDLVRGRWWHTVRVAGFLFVVSIVVGPVFTFALIFTALPLIWINFFGSLIFALLIPFVALGETLLYFDLEARGEAEPLKPRSARWQWWRPRGTAKAPEAAPGVAPSG
ncbi:MAG TPA: hypothetical protein VF081_02965 [Solirubrobacterales bacterium]